MTLGVRLERRHVDDRHVRDVACEFGVLRTNQKLTDEQRVPGVFGEDAGLDPVFGIGAAVEILREQGLAFGMREEVRQQIFEMLFALFAVAVPPDGVFGRCVDDRMLVLRRAAGVMSGLGAKRAAGDDHRLAVANGVFVEGGFGQIPVNRGEIFEAEFIGTIRRRSAYPFPALYPSATAPFVPSLEGDNGNLR